MYFTKHETTERIQAWGWGLSCKKQLGPGRISRVKLRQTFITQFCAKSVVSFAKQLSPEKNERETEKFHSDSAPIHVFSPVPTISMICPCWSVCIQAWWLQRKTFRWTVCDPTVPNMSCCRQSAGIMAIEVLRYAALLDCSLFAQIRSELPIWKVNTWMWNPVALRVKQHEDSQNSGKLLGCSRTSPFISR